MPLIAKTVELAEKIFNSHIEFDRLSHAYLLTGVDSTPDDSEYSDKELFAFQMVIKILASPQSSTDIIERKILEGNHVDVLHIGKDKKEKSIKIESVREMITWSTRKPYESPRKVAIISGAERLTEQAANAFLKTLEESPESTLFLLLTESSDRVLETIKSRCFQMRVLQEFSSDAESDFSISFKEMLDDFAGLKRVELQEKLEGLMNAFHLSMIHSFQGQSGGESTRKTLQAIDLVYESLSALRANVNQKLLITRLVMQLRKLFPGEKRIPA